MGNFVHQELATTDVAGAKKFYASVFGWTFRDVTMGDGHIYVMVSSETNEIGGVHTHLPDGTPPNWLGYVGVASVKKTAQKVERGGGKIIMPITEVPGMGSMVVFTSIRLPEVATKASESVVWVTVRSVLSKVCTR